MDDEEQEVLGEEEEEVRTLGSEEAKQPGVLVVMVAMEPWWWLEWRFG